MDANGTRYQLLLSPHDWGNCSEMEDGSTPLSQLWENSDPQGGASCKWDEKHSELILKPCLLQIVATPSHTPPQLSERRGSDRDRYGNWYWIDKASGELLVNSVGTGNTTHFWALADGIDRGSLLDRSYFQPRQGEEPVLPNPLTLSALVVTEDHYLVVGVLQPKGILVFDLFVGGPPQLMLWPEEVPFTPFDMAPMPGGGVWILDREQARYWALDRYFNVITREQQELILGQEQVDLFQPADGNSERRRLARTFPGGLLLDAAVPIPIVDAVAIEALPDGTVLILASDPRTSFSLIYRYCFARQLGQPVSTEAMKTLIEQDKKEGFHLKGYDFAFVPEHTEDGETVPDRLYVVPEEGNQVYPFNIWQQDDQLVLQPLPSYFPMRMFGGKGLVPAGGQAWYDFSEIWVPLVELRRTRYSTTATLFTPLGEPRHAFDGQVLDCVWHRLLLDACIPHGTSVAIYSRAANGEEELSSAKWWKQPAPYLRCGGSELPFREPVTGEDNGTWELLFQNARGRYLQLKIELTGNGSSTPHLRAMRIYYPRFSYLEHYLPAVYRQDSQSASFLDRFLANLEGFYTNIEDKIAAVQMLFDARSAPSEALDWLAGWFGMALELAWDTNKRRLFLRHAMDFFQYRGTICGLLMILRLTFEGAPDETIFTDCRASSTQSRSVRIVEAFTTRKTGPSPTWTPVQDGRTLRQTYKYFLEQRGLDTTRVNDFPLKAPTDANVLAAWKQCAQVALGFIPSMGDADLRVWWDFLRRRYEKIDALNRAYMSSFSDFEDVPLPEALPPDGHAMRDWHQFQSIVLAMRKSAHQFTVLLAPPVSGITTDYQHTLDLAHRIIEMGKPAHTTFMVNFSVAAFRVGATQLGIDTIVDRGNREPQWMTHVILGQSNLLESYLASQQTLDVTHREVLKREQLS